MAELWIATSNKHKVKEIRDLLMGTNLEIHAANEVAAYSPPHENGLTFEENARIKARSLQSIKPNCWILSDDSGLEVKALQNQPGVFSARYAGPNARDIENNLKLLKQIQLRSSGDDRSAQFRCVMCVLNPQGEEKLFIGTLNGQIARDTRGRNGFGYDPIFVPEGKEKTLAEMDSAEKNRVSHRGQALRQVRDYLLGNSSLSPMR